ncbi:MAG TPA: amidohydrolase [Clostridiales bacterium]|nr:amidohydrolase [Clostridiales bacterium]
MTKEQIMQEAAALQEEIKAHRLWLHTHAETGFDLTETKPYVKSALAEMGYAVQECGKAGLVTTVGKPGGKVLLLRADMDALPIVEEAGVDFVCKNGRMHACGHDMHTAMLLGAAKILKAHESELDGMVKLMFQPAEEIFEGSKDMIASGVLENPRPDAALMIHVAAGMPLPAGTVVVSAPGVSAPAADYFTIRVHGKGCHGSAPQNGIDPLTAAAHILVALQEIHARELSASDEAVLTIGTFHAGEAGNVIPDTATMGGTIRTYDEKTRAYLKKRMTAIAKNVAEAFRADAEVSFGSGCPTLVNDGALSEKVTGYLKDLLGADRAFTTAELSGGKPARGGGSEDFAYVSHEVPSLMLALAAGEPSKGYVYPQHHPKVKFDESVLSTGAAVFVDCAMRYLKE